MGFDLHAGVDRGERVPGAVDLQRTDTIGRMHDLPLQIGQVDPVGIGDAKGPDPGGGEIEQQRRAEAAGADDEDARGQQPDLPLLADFIEDQMPGIALKLLLRELHRVPQIPSNRTVDR